MAIVRNRVLTRAIAEETPATYTFSESLKFVDFNVEIKI